MSYAVLTAVKEDSKDALIVYSNQEVKSLLLKKDECFWVWSQNTIWRCNEPRWSSLNQPWAGKRWSRTINRRGILWISHGAAADEDPRRCPTCLRYNNLRIDTPGILNSRLQGILCGIEKVSILQCAISYYGCLSRMQIIVKVDGFRVTDVGKVRVNIRQKRCPSACQETDDWCNVSCCISTKRSSWRRIRISQQRCINWCRNLNLI